MPKNLPVTNVETILPEEQFIDSRTDLKGVIVETNDAFARISGFTVEEMVGQPHNIVRHPDMLLAALEDLWLDLKAGRPWRGIVKNRRWDGGCYWVVANASPVRENGRLVGYQSVRSCPSRTEVAAAEEAYRRIAAGDTSLKVEHGRVVRASGRAMARFLALPVQLALVGAVALAGPVIHFLGGWVDAKAFAMVRTAWRPPSPPVPCSSSAGTGHAWRATSASSATGSSTCSPPATCAIVSTRPAKTIWGASRAVPRRWAPPPRRPCRG